MKIAEGVLKGIRIPAQFPSGPSEEESFANILFKDLINDYLENLQNSSKDLE